MAEHHPHEPHWYLPLIAADPNWIGQGLGALLMKHALRRCDVEGVAAYLESSNPRNISFYQIRRRIAASRAARLTMAARCSPLSEKRRYSLVEGLEWPAHLPSGGPNVARHFFFAITLIGIGVLLNAPAQAVSAARCEDQASNCVGRCANPGGGTNDNRCMNRCTRQVNSCLIRSHGEAWRW